MRSASAVESVARGRGLGDRGIAWSHRLFERLRLLLEVESSCLLEIRDRFLDRPLLTHRAELGAFGDIEIVLAVDHNAGRCRRSPIIGHAGSDHSGGQGSRLDVLVEAEEVRGIVPGLQRDEPLIVVPVGRAYAILAFVAQVVDVDSAR